MCENCSRLESGPDRGGIGSVIELAMAKQVYQKIDHFDHHDLTSRSLAEVLTVLPRMPLSKKFESLQKKLVY